MKKARSAVCVLCVFSMAAALALGYGSFLRYRDEALLAEKRLQEYVATDYREERYGYLTEDTRNLMRANAKRMPRRLAAEAKRTWRHAYAQIVMGAISVITFSYVLYITQARKDDGRSRKFPFVVVLTFLPYWALYNYRYDERNEWLNFSGFMFYAYVVVHVVVMLTVAWIRLLRKQPNQAL